MIQRENVRKRRKERERGKWASENKQSADFVSKTVCSSLIITLFYSVILIFYGKHFIISILFILFLHCAFQSDSSVIFFFLGNTMRLYGVCNVYYFHFSASHTRTRNPTAHHYSFSQMWIYIVRVKTTDRYMYKREERIEHFHLQNSRVVIHRQLPFVWFVCECVFFLLRWLCYDYATITTITIKSY